MSDYDLAWQRFLSWLKDPIAAATVHGFMFGVLASGYSAEAAAKLAAAEEPGTGNGEESIIALARVSAEELSAGQLTFQLCLPEDTAELVSRVQALIAWVRAFLSGFGSGGEKLRRLDAPEREMLHDLATIAAGASVDEDGNEQDEQAYSNVVEYVRLAVQNLYQTMDHLQRGRMDHQDCPMAEKR